MSEAGSVGGQIMQAKVGACPSFSYVGMNAEGVLAHPQSSIATRSYSDLGTYTSSTIKANQRNLQATAEGAAYGTKNTMSAMDLVFYHQYNSLYGVTEVEGGAPGYFPCSNGPQDGGLRGGGAGSWSFRLDPEVRRKGRLASYRAISFEGKMRSSMKKSFKWFKHKCISLLPGHSSSTATSSPSSHVGISPG